MRKLIRVLCAFAVLWLVPADHQLDRARQHHDAHLVGDVAAEWEPTNGPITIFYRGNAENGEAHYVFPWVRTPGLDFSQLSVKTEGLPGMVNSGDYAGVFEVLRQWADREFLEENSDG